MEQRLERYLQVHGFYIRFSYCITQAKSSDHSNIVKNKNDCFKVMITCCLEFQDEPYLYRLLFHLLQMENHR